MISVLICSANQALLRQVIQNIDETIGLEHEVIHFDNREEKRGICEVYNLLAEKARFPVLCFIHEDILFNSSNWGENLLRLFDEVGADVVGIAGSKYKSLSPSGWYTGIKAYDCVNILHRYPDRSERLYLRPPVEENANPFEKDIACIDGVYIATRRSVWQKLRFNDRDLKGFHFYDIDFSLRAAREFSLVVTYDIDIIHLTAAGGDYGNDWVRTAFLFHKLYSHQLPYTKLIGTDKANNEALVKKTWLEVLKHQRISIGWKWRWVTQQKLYKSPGLYLRILKFLVYQPFGLKKIHGLFKAK